MDLRKRIRYFLKLFRSKYYLERYRQHREQLHTLKGREKIAYVLKKGSKVLAGVPRIRNSVINEARSRAVEHVQRSYTRTIYSYRPKPYFGDVTLLISEKEYESNPNLGWEDLLKGVIEVHKLPGDHTSYIRDNVRIAAQKVRECLEKAETQVRSHT